MGPFTNRSGLTWKRCTRTRHGHLGIGHRRTESVPAGSRRVVPGGEDSHELLGRARFTIFRRLSVEAGELAVSRLRDLMNSADMTWPETQTYQPSTPGSRSTRQGETPGRTQGVLLQSGIEKMAQRLVESWRLGRRATPIRALRSGTRSSWRP